MRIRIGNDIKLRLSLNSKNSDLVNVLSAKVYIVNKTAKQEALRKLLNMNKFFSRFPVRRDFIEPYLNGLEPTERNINIVWDMPYHCYPHDHRVANYHGFGLYPNWDMKYTPMVDNCDITSYKPEVKFTSDRGVIEVLFPAECQLYTGDYDVIVVAKLFKGGYRNDNTMVITSNYSDAFTLIPENETADTDDSLVVIDYAQVNTGGSLDPGDSEGDSYDDYVNKVNYNGLDNVLTLSRRSGKQLLTTIPNNLNWYE